MSEGKPGQSLFDLVTKSSGGQTLDAKEKKALRELARLNESVSGSMAAMERAMEPFRSAMAAMEQATAPLGGALAALKALTAQVEGLGALLREPVFLNVLPPHCRDGITSEEEAREVLIAIVTYIGIKPEQFWRMTPRQIDARLKENQQQADVGRRVLTGTRIGHQKAYGTPENKAERWASYQTTLDAVRAAHPDWKRAEARKEAARRAGTSLRSIERHTKLR